MSGYEMCADQQRRQFQNARHYEGLYRPRRPTFCENTQGRVIVLMEGSPAAYGGSSRASDQPCFITYVYRQVDSARFAQQIEPDGDMSHRSMWPA